MPGGPFADAALQYTRALRTPALGAACGIPQSHGSFPWQGGGTFPGWSRQGQAQPRLAPSPPRFCPFGTLMLIPAGSGAEGISAAQARLTAAALGEEGP